MTLSIGGNNAVFYEGNVCPQAYQQSEGINKLLMDDEMTTSDFKRSSSLPSLLLVFTAILIGFSLYFHFIIQPKIKSLTIVKGELAAADKLINLLEKVEKSLLALKAAAQASIQNPSVKDDLVKIQISGEAASLLRASANDAGKDLELLRDRTPPIDSDYPDHLNQITEEISGLNERINGVLLELLKTADYYSTLSSTKINPASLQQNLMDLTTIFLNEENSSPVSDRLNTFKVKIEESDRKIRELSGRIPEGLEKLYKKNVEIADLLRNFINEAAEDSVDVDELKFSNLYLKLLPDLKEIIDQEENFESEFWEETSIIQRTSEVVRDLDRLLKNLRLFQESLIN